MVKAVVYGAGGRMGRLIIEVIKDTPGIELIGALESAGHEALGKDAGLVAGIGALNILISDKTEEVIQQSQVIIDFTSPEATAKMVLAAKTYRKPMVIGTTALSEDVEKEIHALARMVPVVQTPNMSVGVNLLFSLLPQMVKILGESYDLEIIEAHHRFKKDAPSGTAMKIAKILAEARSLDLEKVIHHGRSGMCGSRLTGEIGLHAVRAGDIVGEHTVVFGGLGERIELTHKAHSRRTFAEGAVRAALFVVGQSAGLYDMQDVLGLKVSS